LVARTGISNGRVATGAVEIYAGTGSVIIQFNSEYWQKFLKKIQKIDINYVQRVKIVV
jgi:hypothetical protein